MPMCWGADYRIKKLNRAIKKFDRKLYAMPGDHGKILIMREFVHMVHQKLGDKSYILFPKREDFMIFPLTDNWLMTGNPVSWSDMRVVQRLQEIDSWNRDVLGEVRSHNEKVQESKDRDFSNNAQAFFSDHYRDFQRQFSDIRTANMDMKKADKRYIYDKRKKD